MSRFASSGVLIPLLVAVAVACAPAAPSPTAAPAKPPEAPKAATAQPAPAQAPKPAAKAGAPGYLFIASHDELLEKAKQEGALKVLSSADPRSLKVIKERFPKAFPFIKFDIQEITGREASQRFLLELKAGAAREWDVIHIPEEDFGEIEPHIAKLDMLGMAEQGVLKINPAMIYPEGRNMVGLGTQLGVVAYNKKLVPAERVPRTWEDLLKPEWKGRKMLTEIRPNSLAALAPAKGQEWLKDFAQKMKEQDPVWSRGNTRALTAMAAGEYMLHSGTYYHSAQRQIDRGADSLAIAVLEPVPVRNTLASGIQQGVKNMHAGLLFLEWMAGPEGQRILDEDEPLKASMHNQTSKVRTLVEGKKLSIADWKWWPRMADLEKLIIEGYGFPKAEVSE